jgi:hypothetical protein
MIVHVNVTQADIDGGRRKQCLNCPEAIALHRATGNRRLMVDAKYICSTGDGRCSLLPPHIVGFVARFDRTGRMKPHEWDIDLPDDWVKNGSGK